MKITEWKTEGTRTTATATYGVFDIKGRELGHILVVDTQACVDAIRDEKGEVIMFWDESGKWASSRYRRALGYSSQACRNGDWFGGLSTKPVEVSSIEEAKAALIKKAEKFEKQIVRKAEKNGGIYK